jgi:hypothetical protein
MLEPGIDQASGLRRSMEPANGTRTPPSRAASAPSPDGRARAAMLPVVGAGEHAECAVRLAQALADGGARILVVSDHDAVLQGLALGRARPGLSALHASRLGGVLPRPEAIDPGVDWVLAAVDDERLVRGPALAAGEAVVLVGADTEGLATAYARIKALVGLGAVRDVCTLFARGSGGAPARLGHQRLARAASRFLGIELAFGGAAPDAAGASAYRRLADDVTHWARRRAEGSAWVPH